MNPEETNNTETPQDDKAARMNKFFEEMNMKIESEDKNVPPIEKPKMQVPLTQKSYVDDLKDLENKTDNLPPMPPIEEKQTFLEALKELKTELDPKADELMGSAFTKAKDLFGKVEKEAKNAFSKFDSYTDDLQARMKKKDEEHETLKKARQEKNRVEDSLFEGTGGLFEKAEKFVKSQEQKTAKKEGEITIIPAVVPDKPVKKVVDPNETVYGFEDLDGDGDPIMDDAIIEE
jgi:hypothetical protein